jgi:hypothetical protein
MKLTVEVSRKVEKPDSKLQPALGIGPAARYDLQYKPMDPVLPGTLSWIKKKGLLKRSLRRIK